MQKGNWIPRKEDNEKSNILKNSAALLQLYLPTVAHGTPSTWIDRYELQFTLVSWISTYFTYCICLEEIFKGKKKSF